MIGHFFLQKQTLYWCCSSAKFSSFCEVIFIFSCIFSSLLWRTFLWFTRYLYWYFHGSCSGACSVPFPTPTLLKMVRFHYFISCMASVRPKRLAGASPKARGGGGGNRRMDAQITPLFYRTSSYISPLPKKERKKKPRPRKG